jgi:hypothetical protein
LDGRCQTVSLALRTIFFKRAEQKISGDVEIKKNIEQINYSVLKGCQEGDFNVN